MKTVLRALSCLVLLVSCADGDEGERKPSECVQDRDCDDSIACSVDRCLLTIDGNKRCSNTPDDDLCGFGMLCMIESRLGPGCQDQDELACAGKPDGASCQSASACATGPGECVGNRCEYPVLECADRPCMNLVGCDRQTGTCRYVISANETACDADGDRCTVDSCSGGLCVQGPDECECSDARPCVQPANRCLGTADCRDGKCILDAVDCSVADTDCLNHYCVAATGLCASTPVNEGMACQDGLACTASGTCRSGACVTRPLECPARACNDVECVEPDGCIYSPLSGPCDDGNLCNGSDSCQGGQCLPSGEGIVCNDMNACTLDSCLPDSGQCVFVPVSDCCGNGLLEQGEQCDGPGEPGNGCHECIFAVASLDFQGASPCWTWSPGEPGSGMAAWEMLDLEGRRGLAVRPMNELGILGVTIPVPAGTVSGRSMSPVLLAAPDGFVLGALTPAAPTFWLLDRQGRPRIFSTVKNPWNQGQPTGRMVAAISFLRSIAAWSVDTMDGRQQLLYSDLAVGPGQVIASGSSVLYTSDRGGAVVPGDACPIDGGVLLMFTVRSEPGNNSLIFQKAAILTAGSSDPVILDLAESEWDQPLTGRCASAQDGSVMVVYPRLGAKPGQALKIESVLIDPESGVGQPDTVLSVVSGDNPTLFPFMSELVQIPGGWYLFICPGVSPNLYAPESIVPYAVAIEPDGSPGGLPVPVAGPGAEFVGAIAAGPAGDGQLLMLWVQTTDSSQIHEKGEVAGRVYLVDQGGIRDED